MAGEVVENVEIDDPLSENRDTHVTHVGGHMLASDRTAPGGRGWRLSIVGGFTALLVIQAAVGVLLWLQAIDVRDSQAEDANRRAELASDMDRQKESLSNLAQAMLRVVEKSNRHEADATETERELEDLRQCVNELISDIAGAR